MWKVGTIRGNEPLDWSAAQHVEDAYWSAQGFVTFTHAGVKMNADLRIMQLLDDTGSPYGKIFNAARPPTRSRRLPIGTHVYCDGDAYLRGRVHVVEAEDAEDSHTYAPVHGETNAQECRYQ